MKLTANIAMCYPNAKVWHSDMEYDVCAIYKGNNTIDVIHDKNGIRSYGALSIADCQLILTPLDKISDEDAVALCGLVGWDASEAGKIESSGFGTDEKIELKFQFHSYRIKQSVQLISYCQSHSIDIGHGYGDNHIPSLIAAGVAVEKTKEI